MGASRMDAFFGFSLDLRGGNEEIGGVEIVKLEFEGRRKGGGLLEGWVVDKGDLVGECVCGEFNFWRAERRTKLNFDTDTSI